MTEHCRLGHKSSTQTFFAGPFINCHENLQNTTLIVRCKIFLHKKDQSLPPAIATSKQSV